MKKVITLSAILALTLATVAEAKGGRSSGFRSSPSRAVATQPKQQAQPKQQTQRDATFENTRATQTAQPQVQAANGSRLGSLATGAAAGYLLSEMLTPSEAQANQATQPAATQAVENGAANANSQVAEFKSIGGQIDPFLIEKTDGYRRYCIEGVQYLIPALAGQTVQASPVVMVKPNGSPLECRLVP